MISCILSCVVLAAMLYGRVPTAALAVACGLLATVLMLTRRRKHSHSAAILHMDTLAINARLSSWNAGYKAFLCAGLLVFCLASRNIAAPVCVGLAVSMVSIYSARLSVGDYLALLMVPAGFVLLSGLAIMVEISSRPLGLLDIPLLGNFLSLTKAGQASAAALMSHAFGGLCCLYALSLSTPMYELTAFLRRIHTPVIIVELMVLIYRYIFVLLAALNSMSTAATSRLGYSCYRNSWRSFTGIGSNLLARSFRKAGAGFDAMESRCYDGELRFLESGKPVRGIQLAVAAVLMMAVIAQLAAERGLL